MRFDLESGTDAAHHVVFDSHALTASEEAKEDPLEWLEHEVDAGRALGYKAGGDGDFNARLIIDEPVPPELAEHAHQVVEDALLRVPGGTLWMVGAEYAADIAAAGDGAQESLPHMGTRVGLPAANYRADVFLLDWSEDLWESTLKERTSRLDRSFHNVLSGNTVGCAVICGVFILPGVALLNGRYLLALTMFASTLAALTLLLFGLWLIGHKLGPLQRMEHALTELQHEFPDAIIRLETLPPDADLSAMKGAWFHEDDFPDPQAGDA